MPKDTVMYGCEECSYMTYVQVVKVKVKTKKENDDTETTCCQHSNGIVNKYVYHIVP